MSTRNLSKEQEYLLYLLPQLDDCKIREIMSVVRTKNRSEKKSVISSALDSTPYNEIMSMVGCQGAKECISAIIAAHRMNQIVSQRKNLTSNPHYHIVFSGNPGCNKTTLARLYAKVLHLEGIVKKDCYAELTRGDLCGRYQGETSQKVIKVFNKYAGGVIFIDEAYSLDDTGGDVTTYGEEAIDQIIVELENRADTVVIFAGYPEKMEQFLESNPGLRSRIPYRVDFKDYTAVELVQISQRIAKDNGFTISDLATDKLQHVFEVARNAKGFGNGRFCRNIVEKAIQQKSLNLGVMKSQSLDEFYDHAKFSDETLFTLDEDCFELPKMSEEHPVRKIGF